MAGAPPASSPDLELDNWAGWPEEVAVVAAVVVVAAPNPDEADPDPGAAPDVGGGETRDSGVGIVTGAALGAGLV